MRQLWVLLFCLMATSCANTGISLGVGTGFGFGGRHGGVNIGVGGTIPVSTTFGGIHSSAQVPAGLMTQEASSALKKINQLRKNQQIGSLKVNSSLQAFAEKRAQELSQKYSHQRPDGRLANDQLQGGTLNVELIAKTNSLSADEAIAAWRKQSSRLVENTFNAAGIAAYSHQETTYWVLILGDEKSVAVY